MNIAHKFCELTLPLVARLHHRNWTKDRWKYPQLWFVTVSWLRRGSWKHKSVVWLCGKLTGHELSDTEWGYGGGGMVDRHCRWCDKLIQVPFVEEQAPSTEVQDLANTIESDKPEHY